MKKLYKRKNIIFNATRLYIWFAVLLRNHAFQNLIQLERFLFFHKWILFILMWLVNHN